MTFASAEVGIVLTQPEEPWAGTHRLPSHCTHADRRLVRSAACKQRAADIAGRCREQPLCLAHRSRMHLLVIAEMHLPFLTRAPRGRVREGAFPVSGPFE